MIFQDGKIFVSFDDQTGVTNAICNPNDPFHMNWVLENSDWSSVDNFEVCNVSAIENGIKICCENEKWALQCAVEKTVKNGEYIENYCFTNHARSEFFFTRDHVGIHFPYNCTFEKKENMHENSCVTHVWCGGDITWMYSAKPSGDPSYLVCNAVQGRFADYSISYDVSRVRSGASYRGDIVLHPEDFVLAPEQSMTFSLVFCFSDRAPDQGELSERHRMSLCADRYSAFVGQPIHCHFASLDEWDQLDIRCDGENVGYEKRGNEAVWSLCFQTPGEKNVLLSVNGKQTWMKVNILRALDDMLIKRAEFITQKQQYHKDGSCLDGAYLIYDRKTGRQYYNERFTDHNACRERLSMGVVVAQALQKKFDADMMQSLIKHRQFIEREVFDVDTATVCDEVGKDKQRNRAYNYPWAAVYYLEWYHLTGEVTCLEYAARIMIAYYEGASGKRQESPCIRIHEICQMLEKQGLCELRERMLSCLYAHADRIIQNGSLCFSEEVSCTQFMFNGKINILCQAYFLSGDEKYLEYVPALIEKSNAFCGQQPDFHVNNIAVRYWDLYWFGKTKIYGDSMPQWLSALSGETYDFLYQTGFGEQFKHRSEAVLMNNLCVYFEDGFASAGYLVPYKVHQYSSDETYQNPSMKPGMAYGHIYDDYANDQDWAMYYAVKMLGEE